MGRVLCVSVDVDSPALYLRLYGIKPDQQQLRDLAAKAYALGVLRFVELFGELDLPATFFLVGQDLAGEGAAGVARGLVQVGHEAANHSHSHPYDLVRLDEAARRAELADCHRAISEATGVVPQGFRAPGYNTTPALLGQLAELGYLYDASALPSWPYLAAKYAVMTGLLLRGKKSSSIWGNPLMGLGARGPAMAEVAGPGPKGKKGPAAEGPAPQRLVKIPCTVTPLLRLPVIGTFLVSGPKALQRHLVNTAAQEDFVSLEFHAMDLMSVVEDDLPSALAAQKDLTLPWQQKREAIKQALQQLASNRQCQTLATYARGRS